MEQLTLYLDKYFTDLLPLSLSYFISILIFSALILGIMLLSVLFFTWWERKVSAHFQDRLGPMRVGGFHGWAQPIADALKLLVKEDIVPTASVSGYFHIASLICFIAVFLGFSAIAFSSSVVAADINLGLFFIAAVTPLSVLGILMGAWASGNKWSLLGGMRSCAQIVSYEVPLTFSMVPIVMLSSTLNMSEIVHAQAGGFLHWFIFRNPFTFISFFVYFIASLAENNRAPFDLPESESELIAGFFTEYSGLRFAFFFLAEYAEMFLVSALSVTLFLGGWEGLCGESFIPGIILFIFKTVLLVTIQMWFRWTFPRLRVDQLMSIAWKYLLPVTFINIAGVGLLMIV